ncbi:MAG TPA: c-type cytochrome [Verrucomicrobiae bacterium]|nr:c-type cytochrome [Verrucomicrobiae bacterium]
MQMPPQFKAWRWALMLGFLGLSAATVHTQSTSSTSAVATPAETSSMISNVATNPTYLHDILPLFLGRCSRCHNDQTTFLPNWLDYKTAYAHRAEIRRRVWDSWKDKYFKESMPVANCPECRTITEDDRALIRDWVDAGAAYGVPPPTSVARNKDERIEIGKRLYTITCVPCHQANAQGIPYRYPPLAESDFLNAGKDQAIKVLINGRQGAILVNGLGFTNSMPRFPLSDEQVANVLTYVYNSFGNSGKEVTPDEVKTARAEKAEPTAPNPIINAAPSKFE